MTRLHGLSVSVHRTFTQAYAGQVLQVGIVSCNKAQQGSVLA